MDKNSGKKMLAFDLGASSGRGMIGTLENDRIYLETVHRFQNKPEYINDSYYWNIIGLFQEMKNCLLKLRDHEKYGNILSVGVDTWGVDYGLLNENGRLMGQVFHYRDSKNDKGTEMALKIIDKKELYELTGVQFATLNTIFQLYSQKCEEPYILENAKDLLLLPDLFNYFLSGVRNTDYSFASTSGLLDINTKDWCWEIIDKLGFPRGIFGKVEPSGKFLGNLSPKICNDLNIEPMKVISVAAHDTASAVVGVPSLKKDVAYISCGTWSLFGTELDIPINSAEAFKYNFTNEGGYNGKIRFLKNIMGTWLIQQSGHFWNNHGNNFDYVELANLAQKEEIFKSFIDVDAPMFFPPGDIPNRVVEYCKTSGQPVPTGVGAIMQCIYGSLVMKYRYVFDKLKMLTNKDYEIIHMVGGGIQDSYLCQQTANVCDVKIVAGPVEATVVGNVAVQFMVNGFIKDIEAARAIVSNSFEMKTYLPSKNFDVDRSYSMYKKVLGLDE